MARPLDPAVMRRARDAAQQAPSGRHIVDRAKRPLRYSDKALRWATKVPGQLLAILEDAKRLESEEHAAKKDANTARQSQQKRAQTLLAEVNDYPGLSQVIEEALSKE